MSKLVYDGSAHTVELIDSSKNSVGTWVAYNNIDSKFAKAHYKGLTHLNNGVYTVLDTSKPYSHVADPDGPYGSYGIIRFNYPGHSGVGVHAGRAHAKNAPGAQHATHGCIRTTDEAMKNISAKMADDPIDTVEVKGSNNVVAKHGTTKHARHHHV